MKLKENYNLIKSCLIIPIVLMVIFFGVQLLFSLLFIVNPLDQFFSLLKYLPLIIMAQYFPFIIFLIFIAKYKSINLSNKKRAIIFGTLFGLVQYFFWKIGPYLVKSEDIVSNLNTGVYETKIYLIFSILYGILLWLLIYIMNQKLNKEYEKINHKRR